MSGEKTQRLWRVRGRDVLFAERPLVMGILNVTPDSFSDGGRYASEEAAVRQALSLAESGADVIDVGGQSTRPGFEPVAPREEWSRIGGVLAELCRRDGALRTRGALVSVDTYEPEVARLALGAGADILNDVTGFERPEMRAAAAESGCGCVVMHSADIASLLPDRTDADGNILLPDIWSAAADATVSAVAEFFGERLAVCAADGVAPETVALDVGVGFGKSRSQDFVLLARMGECRRGGRPLLAAASRKRVVRTFWRGMDADDATVLAHILAVTAGADMVRVHAVR